MNWTKPEAYSPFDQADEHFDDICLNLLTAFCRAEFERMEALAKRMELERGRANTNQPKTAQP